MVKINDDKEEIVRKLFDVNEGKIPDFNVHIMTDPQVIFDDAITLNCTLNMPRVNWFMEACKLR